MRELSYEEIEQQEAYSMTNLWSEYTKLSLFGRWHFELNVLIWKLRDFALSVTKVGS